MTKIKVTQTSSKIARPDTQEKTLKALGLGRIGQTKILKKDACVEGQIKKVAHLVKTEEVK